MRILIDLQPLQILGAATRGVGRYTNGLLSALVSVHDVIGMRRACPYLVPPSADVPTVEIASRRSETELEQQLSNRHFDVVINCSGPFWEENVIVSGLRNTTRPIVASIFYDVIPWVFPDVYLPDPQVRRGYHNRCVDLYARADLVCAISQHSERDALRFGYATEETATTISLGVEQLVPEALNAREKWKISQSYLLSVSGDEFRKNPELLIAAYLQSDIRKSHSLIIVISNDTGFSNRMEAKYGNLRAQDVVILPEVTESELGALYRDCDAFVFTSLYEGFGIPIVEAMQFGKWIVSAQTSSLAEVSGPALLSLIEDPAKLDSIVFALNEAKQRLGQGLLEGSIPDAQGRKFSWAQVVRNFENAVERRRKTVDLKSSTQKPERPRLFWASPFPADVSGIAFYSEDLIGPVSKDYDIILVPNTVSTFVPTPKTGRFKIEEARAEALLALSNDAEPLVFYNIGNSHFHLELLDLLFKLPGIVLLHDSFVGGLEGLWRERLGKPATDQSSFPRNLANSRLRRWYRTLRKLDRLLQLHQPTRGRRILSVIARLPGMRLLLLNVAEFLRRISVAGFASPTPVSAWQSAASRPLDVQIIESSRGMLYLGEHAKSLIAPEHLARRPTHVVPLYCRFRGAISATNRTELRRKYSIPQDAFVVTTTGFQATIKLTDEVIRSCKDLEQFESGARVYVQVLGEFVDQAFETKVRTLWTRNNLNGFISDGFVDEVTLTERVALSDVAIYLRSASTGGPSAGLNDAMGMGIPSLVTDDFAFREYPKTAVLHVPNTEVSEGLILLYRYPEVRQRLAAGGLEYAKNASLEAVVARLCEIFTSQRQTHSTRQSMAKAGQSREPVPHVFVDITYGLMQKVRSGLQRVEREIATGLHDLDPAEKYFRFVAWDRTSRQFRLVTLRHLMGRDDSPLMETWLAKCPVAAINDDAHLFALSFSWPLGDEYFIDLLELSFRGVQLAILLPDLIPLRHRWTFYANYPEGSGIDQFKVFCKQVVPECFNVLTISSYAERDIQRMLLEDSNRKGKRKKVPKTHVLKLGADWCTPFENTQISAALPSGERLVKNSYLLYVSSLDVRKNHEALLKAVAQVRKVVDNLDLVLVGRVDGSISAETLEFIRRSSWVHHFEGVDDATLHRLYVDCLFTVFPSLDEGYGLPVVESLRHGKFCLASQAGAIPEAGGAFADYFDPCDVGMLAEKILLYITNPEELQKREKLLASYRPTSWRETARQVAQIFYGDMAEYIFMAQESTKRPFV